MKKEQNLQNAETQALNIPVVSNRTLSKNRGMVIFNREILTKDPTEDELKAIFSNFYPIAIENEHSYNLYQNLKMFGYSQHFREVEESEICPKYKMFFRRDENGLHFEKMVELVEQLP